LAKVTDSLQDFCQKFSKAVQNIPEQEETTTEKTSQKRKVVRDPELPKRPLGSYFHFCNEQRKLNEKETHLDPYVNMGDKDWETYREAMAEYKVTHPDAKKQKTTETKPKGEALSKSKSKEVAQAPGQENSDDSSDNSSSGDEETATKNPESFNEEEEDENSEEEKSAFKKFDSFDENDSSNEEDSSEEEKNQSDSSDDSDSEDSDSSSDEE
ncbi:hypothetical protein CU098_001199, partial [Rhizopus stolonifer]